MTVGRYVSPSGSVLGGKGLSPDERVLVFPGETGARTGSSTAGWRSPGPAGPPGGLGPIVSAAWPGPAGHPLPARPFLPSSLSSRRRPLLRSRRPAPKPPARPAPRPPTRRRHPAPGRASAPPGARRGRPGRPPVRDPARPASIAIVIDDLGNDPAAAERIASWPYPVAGAVLPRLPGSAWPARRLANRVRTFSCTSRWSPPDIRGAPRARGRAPTQSDEEIVRTLHEDLDTVPGAVGVNNHMGSAATSDPRVMGAIVGVLAGRGLFFVDSRTTDSTGRRMAQEARLPTVSRRSSWTAVASRAVARPRRAAAPGATGGSGVGPRPSVSGHARRARAGAAGAGRRVRVGNSSSGSGRCRRPCGGSGRICSGRSPDAGHLVT